MQIMGQGFPLMAHNTDRVPTLSGVKRSRVNDLDWESSQARETTGESLKGFYILGLNLSLKPETVNEV
jgi:hypothetical protein